MEQEMTLREALDKADKEHAELSPLDRLKTALKMAYGAPTQKPRRGNKTRQRCVGKRK